MSILDQGTIVVSLRAKPAHTSRLLQSQAARSVREPTIFISHTPRAARVCAVTPHSAPKHAPHRFAGFSASRARLAAPFKSRTARASRRVRTAQPRDTLRRSCPTKLAAAPRPRPRRARGARLDAARRGRRGRRARRRAAAAARRDEPRSAAAGALARAGAGPAATRPHPQKDFARRKVAERTHAAATRRATTSPCLNS